MINIFSFIIVLGILVFFHEFGHFLVARLFGVGVEKFSLGFGPRLFGKTSGITDYRVSAIPLGGYVKMVGEEPDAEIDPKDIPISFTHKHVVKRILIVAAGPLFNLLLAVLIFFGIFLTSGAFTMKASVGEVGEGTPAYEAGIQPGDQILAINETPIESWDEMAQYIGECKGEEITTVILRGESLFTINIVPERKVLKNIFGEDTERYVIGVTAAGEVFSRKLTLFQAVGESIVQTYEITELTIISIVKLIDGTISAKTLGGPIMIAEMAGDQAKRGVVNLMFFIALLSINLAILNFLPIPVLDGGHLVFFSIELVMGRPVNTKAREIAQQAGMLVLFLLMIYVFYNDIARILS